MKQSSNDNQPATRGDVREIVTELVGEIVGEIVGSALQLISDQLATKADKSDIVRLENKLDATIENVDNLNSKWRLQFGSS